MGLTRRGFLIGAAAVIAAPALVQRANVMAVRPLVRGHSLTRLWSAQLLEKFNEATVFGENVNRPWLIALDPADKDDYAAIARYERKGGHVLIRDIQILQPKAPWL